MARQFLSVKNAAKRLDASAMTVYRLVYAGKLTGYPIGLGKTKPRIRIDEDELTAFMRGAR